jgi:hypothetical protein
MKENLSALWITLALIAVFVVGSFAGANLYPKEVEVIKNVPGEKVTEYVNQTVEVEVEVQDKVLDDALATFLEAVEDEEVKDEDGNEVDLLKNYDFDEVSVNKVFDEYQVFYEKDKTIVEFQVRLKYDEKGDSERSVRETYSVRVTYEEDEDSRVEATIVVD